MYRDWLRRLHVGGSKSGFGCFIGEVFLGALAYADDIVLLAPTHRAMRNMLALCDKFGSDYYVVLTPKSQSVCTLTHVPIALGFQPLCPCSQLAVMILSSWMSGLILGILLVHRVMIKPILSVSYTHLTLPTNREV